MNSLWARIKSRLVILLGSDIDVVRKVEQLDQHQRELGHRLKNLEMRRDAIARLVESMRGDEGNRDGQRLFH